MVRPEIGKTALSLAVASALAAGFSEAQASAFALMEQNASGLGNAFAGQAAAAEDASTIFFNPAGMSLLAPGPQVSGGFDYINPSTKFSNGGSIQSGVGVAIPTATRPLGGEGGEAGHAAAVPNVYFATDVAPRWKVGVGVSVPFGLKTEYDPDWMGRFLAIKSEISTLNINPSVSYKASDKASVGFGLNYQQIDAEFTRAVNYVVATAAVSPAAAAAIPAANAEGTVKVEAKNSAWGWNVGAMFQLAEATRLGVAYRSSIKYHLTGTTTFNNVPAVVATSPNFTNSNASIDIELPDSATIGLRHQIDPKWTLLADATWTGWSKIKELKIVRDNGTAPDTTPENFKNTWRIGVGATYRYSDAWSIKMGVAHDQTPVNDTDRTPRLPDQDRNWLSFGGQYRLSAVSTLDFGYAHLFVKDASINQNGGNTTLNGQLVGTYKASINIFGVQFAYRF